MKLPENVFVVLNPLVRWLLTLPTHRLFSDSLMLITFTGRRSGKSYTTPVRYVRDGQTIRCFTSTDTRWWRNLRGGAEVTLRVRGQALRCRAIVIANDPDAVRARLAPYLQAFPQDAAYYDIRLSADRRPDPADLERALADTIVVEATPHPV